MSKVRLIPYLTSMLLKNEYNTSCLRLFVHHYVIALEMQKVETIDRDDPPESVPPKFLLSLKDKKVFQGKGTTLDCVIKGVPEPTVKWLRHGKEIFPRSGKYLLTVRIHLFTQLKLISKFKCIQH